MKKKILIICVIMLLIAEQTLASFASINSVSIVPNQPLNTDLISFNIFGLAAGSNSWVDHDVFSKNGTSIQLDLYIDVGMSGTGSYWYFDKQIQPLVPGTYILEVRAFDGREGSPWRDIVQDTYNGSFTVAPEPTTLALLGLGLPFIRTLAKRKK